MQDGDARLPFGVTPGQVIPTNTRLLLQIHYDLDCLLQWHIQTALGYPPEKIIETLKLNVKGT